jgi:hypothetical protein
MKHLLPLAIISLALSACAEPSPVTHVQPDEPSAGKRMAMEWYAYSQGEDEMGIPQNNLSLKVVSTSEVLFTTTCEGTTQVADIADLADSVTYIRCWWAGGGEDFAVFIGEAEQAVIRHRTVDEEGGYGEWEDLKSL